MANDRLSVAVLGIGTMGAAMAANIAAAMGLRVWDRTRDHAEPLAKDGAVVGDSPADASRGADVVPNTPANEAIASEVMNKARNGFSDATVWLQSSTVSPEGSRRLAEQADRLGVDYVEAPLLGAKEPAVAGTLTVLAASRHMDTRARVQPVFGAVGSRTVWLDDIGQPSALKLAYNAWVLTTVGGIAESLTLANALGVNPTLLAEVICGSALNSGYVQTRAPMMIADDLDTPSFPLAVAAKDAAGDSGLGRADVAAAYRVPRRGTEKL